MWRRPRGSPPDHVGVGLAALDLDDPDDPDAGDGEHVRGACLVRRAVGRQPPPRRVVEPARLAREMSSAEQQCLLGLAGQHTCRTRHVMRAHRRPREPERGHRYRREDEHATAPTVGSCASATMPTTPSSRPDTSRYRPPHCGGAPPVYCAAHTSGTRRTQDAVNSRRSHVHPVHERDGSDGGR